MDIIKKIVLLPTIKETITEYNIVPKKSLGQNFILDINLTRRIAKTGNCYNKNIIEIGPGPGSLTRALFVEGAKSIIAIEKDPRSVKSLNSLIKIVNSKLKIINKDAKNVLLNSIGTYPQTIISNLPYNIATNLLTSWLLQINKNEECLIDNITVTIQKEVANRIIAKPGNKNYGRLSIFMNLLSDQYINFNIPPSAFSPSPKVESSVISIFPLSKPRYEVNIYTFQKIVSLAFNQRRKMLRQSLKTIGGASLLKKSAINEKLRAENLSTKDYCIISNCFDDIQI